MISGPQVVLVADNSNVGIPPRRGAEDRLGLSQVLGCQNTPFEHFVVSDGVLLFNSRPATNHHSLLTLASAKLTRSFLVASF